MSAVTTQEPQPFNTATWLKDSVAAIAAAAERWGHCAGVHVRLYLYATCEN
ncbi:hypothetical protein [Corynebacterium argentoratense]|uniref:hypothetical protein n=1 Tax=Corynebacterium argentoratense TaxID=42817 RepID=UPI003C6FD7BC